MTADQTNTLATYSPSSPPPSSEKAVVVLFWADWHEDSVRLKDQILPAFVPINPTIQFGTVEAEVHPDFSQKYGVSVVPTLLIMSNGKVTQKLEGQLEIHQVTQAVQVLAQERNSTTEDDASASISEQEQPPPSASLDDRLKELITSHEVMLFMKGKPDAPRCGFSRQAVELLQADNIAFGSFDILTDEEVRQGLKTYSDWPTYPQLYVKGELMGGLDILKEMKEEGSGSLAEALDVQPQESLDERLKNLTNRSRIMLFMKGLPSAPKCGFSRQICELLEGYDYDSFNILQDEEVRQGLKKFSDWPTYPQLYVDGDLVGGLDICREMKESGDLDDLLKG